MSESFTVKPIGYIHSDFTSKFGIPRQSGLAGLSAKIVFEPQYAIEEAFRGIEKFSHIWLLWQFSQNEQKPWSPTVRPPRLGGNTRVGVFASRSPFRPNSIGLSSVRLEQVEHHPTLGTVLHILGADLMDGTPIYDIKPYLPYTDSHPDASAGFAGEVFGEKVRVEIADNLLEKIPGEKREGLLALLAEDPRPAVQNDPERLYGMSFAGFEVRFTVSENLLTVREIEKI
ncbi:MAG: tRNA (N6-threonylcarbamoyladenosine(37)-N6)-methyltransferase TrmO [Clostridia bacterium]|nr:tRNA (N6-threonylcarbamoyladenosine(37)-N6)-methyltransferase TrmO [Clostridia bacterium]